tara:strand:- start:17765 stop:18154 length:390 start_codon:yes stop_codon:yes gene_type:complete
MDEPTPQMQAIAAAFAQALMPVVAMLAQPAQTVTQAVTTVAKTGQRRIPADVKRKVKALRAQNGGPLHSHDPTWKLIDDGIVTEQGDLIADVKAPSAGTTVTVAPLKTDKQLMRMKKADLIAIIQEQNA